MSWSLCLLWDNSRNLSFGVRNQFTRKFKRHRIWWLLQIVIVSSFGRSKFKMGLEGSHTYAKSQAALCRLEGSQEYLQKFLHYMHAYNHSYNYEVSIDYLYCSILLYCTISLILTYNNHAYNDYRWMLTVQFERASFFRHVMSCKAVSLSSPLVGSSKKIMLGLVTKPSATLNLLLSPPLMPLMPDSSSPTSVSLQPSSSYYTDSNQYRICGYSYPYLVKATKILYRQVVIVVGTLFELSFSLLDQTDLRFDSTVLAEQNGAHCLNNVCSYDKRKGFSSFSIPINCHHHY